MVTAAVVLLALYVYTHPLVFNESWFAHAHCIVIAGLSLEEYALKHDGRFPYDPKGYGNALLQLDEDTFHTLTGPGYSDAPFFEAKSSGKDLQEEECGRVYIQGLTKKSDPNIVLLFDKLPTPGGDHCHLPRRLWASLGREFWTVGAGHSFVEESDWPAFAKEQVNLLVKEGFAREEAERLYASKAKQ
jgi:hypothetical protein